RTVAPSRTLIVPLLCASANVNVASTGGSPPLVAGSVLCANSAYPPGATLLQSAALIVFTVVMPLRLRPFRSNAAAPVFLISNHSWVASLPVPAASARNSVITSWPAAGFTIARGVPLSRHWPALGSVGHWELGRPGVPKSLVVPVVW